MPVTDEQVEAALKAFRVRRAIDTKGKVSLHCQEREWLYAALIDAEAKAWQPISAAPMWFGNNEAIVGQFDGDGRLIKISVWDAAWNRDGIAGRGGTHFRIVGRHVPAGPNDEK